MMSKWKRATALLAVATTFFAYSGNLSAKTHEYNDPYSLAEYYLDDTGVSSVLGEKNTSTHKVKVAIYDTGFDYNHEDLSSVWVQDKQLFDKLVGSDNEYAHGTACASVLSMVVDNGIGGAGVCPDVELYPISYKTNGISDYYEPSTGNNSLTDAIIFCMEHDIKILSISLGGVRADSKILDIYKGMGGIIVCSAGNDAKDNDVIDHYPSNYIKDYDNMLVATVTCDGKYGTWANYGKNTVSLGSPGEAMMVANKDDSYRDGRGTSFAAPYTAGVVALLSSYYPNATMDQIKDAIMEGVDKQPSLQDRCISGGSINAKKAMEILQKKLGCEISEGEYYIRNNQDGRYLTCYGNTTGTNVSTTKFFNYESNEQKWRVEFTKDNNYVIFPADNQDNCLEVYNNQCSLDGNNVWQNEFNETENQEWELEKEEDGSFKILSAGDTTYGVSAKNTAIRNNKTINQDTLALEDSDNANTWTFEKIDELYSDTCFVNFGNKKYLKASNNTVIASDFVNEDSEKWMIKYRGNGYYTISPQVNEWICIEINERGKLQFNGYQEEDAKQLWKVIEDETGLHIQSKLPEDLCLSYFAGDDMEVYKYSGADDDQNVNFENVDSILNGTFAIRNVSTNKYLVSTSNDANEQLSFNDFINGTAEKFIIDYVGNGIYNFKPYGNQSLCLDVYSGTLKNNWAVWQYPKNRTKTQKWKIEQNEDMTYTIASASIKSFVWNYNATEESKFTDSSFSVKIKDDSSLTQKWYLEDLAKTLDGKTFSTVSTKLSGSVIEYIGNDYYMFAKGEKHFQVYETSDREKLTAQGVPTSCMKIISLGNVEVGNKNGCFLIKKLRGSYYIIPSRYLYTGVNHSCRNEYLDASKVELRWEIGN